MKFIIVQNGDIDISGGPGDWEVLASAGSIADAKAFIREEVLRYFDPESIYDDMETQCSHYAIYELKAAFKPVPAIKVSLRLRNVTKEIQ